MNQFFIAYFEDFWMKFFVILYDRRNDYARRMIGSEFIFVSVQLKAQLMDNHKHFTELVSTANSDIKFS